MTTPLAVYVHIPFCTVKCGYCDFNAYAGLDDLKPTYNRALLAEIAGYEPLLRERPIVSIAFGGGTPGEVPAEDIAAVVRAVTTRGHLLPGAEVSLEANPGTLTLPQLQALHGGGVTRLSLGAQSFDSAELAFLDRIHSPEATAAALRLARRAGFQSVNLDLIYALPGQTLERWEANLNAAIALEPDHISTYCLTVEDGTPLARRVRTGRITPADPDLAADMYERAAVLLTAAGFEQYELSNWARPGHQSRHNLVYWTGGDYLGLGAGAHGFIDGLRYENIAHPSAYITALLSPAPGANPARLPSEPLPRFMAMSDFIALGLRLVAGFDPAAFEARFGVSLDAVAGPPLAESEADGLLERTRTAVRLTPRGRLLHNEVAVRVLVHLEASA